ncbi:MAG: transglycosylase SLT domain-containing protein [Anaerolineales bacterium]|nr:transglycosylase SLT domain-containing protein [Anaerolineales bacterium]
MQQRDFSSVQYQNREAGQASGCLSVLLYPPVSAVIFGALLFWGLLNLPFSTFMSKTERTANSPAAANDLIASAPFTNGGLTPLFTPQVMRWEAHIVRWAAEHGLDPNLVATVMQIESCGHPRALSRAGAQGLFQVMPYHFADGEDAFAPETNALRGLNYLRNSLAHFDNNASMALAGYNGGINGASRPREAWAQETRDYQYWGENIYTDAAAGRNASPVLAEWLAAGGASLCAQAERQAMAP